MSCADILSRRSAAVVSSSDAKAERVSSKRRDSCVIMGTATLLCSLMGRCAPGPGPSPGRSSAGPSRKRATRPLDSSVDAEERITSSAPDLVGGPPRAHTLV